MKAPPLVAITCLVGLQFSSCNNPEREAEQHRLEAFQSEVDAFSTLPPKTTDGDPYLKGNVLIIERYTAKLILTGGIFGKKLVMKKTGEDPSLDGKYSPSSLTFQLPSNMQPVSPRYVNTIVLLDYDLMEVGSYASGAKAYTMTCKVTIIDKSVPCVVGEDMITGSEPPSSLPGRGDTIKAMSGDPPEIVEFLLGLKRLE